MFFTGAFCEYRFRVSSIAFLIGLFSFSSLAVSSNSTADDPTLILLRTLFTGALEGTRYADDNLTPPEVLSQVEKAIAAGADVNGYGCQAFGGSSCAMGSNAPSEWCDRKFHYYLKEQCSLHPQAHFAYTPVRIALGYKGSNRDDLIRLLINKGADPSLQIFSWHRFKKQWEESTAQLIRPFFRVKNPQFFEMAKNDLDKLLQIGFKLSKADMILLREGGYSEEIAASPEAVKFIEYVLSKSTPELQQYFEKIWEDYHLKDARAKLSQATTPYQLETLIVKYDSVPVSSAQSLVKEAKEKLRVASLDARTRADQQRARSELQRKSAEETATAVAVWRTKLKIGDDTFCGPVIEVRQPMIKIAVRVQLPGYSSEAWLKANEVYPDGAGCRNVNGRLSPAS